MNEDDQLLDCDACGSSAVYLGNLHRLAWFRCQGCGIEFNHLTYHLPEYIVEKEIRS